MTTHKPMNTRKWTDEDIQDVKSVLPQGLSFATLTTPNTSSFQLSVDLKQSPRELTALSETVTDELMQIGVPVNEVQITAGYNGGGPVPLLTIIME